MNKTNAPLWAAAAVAILSATGPAAAQNASRVSPDGNSEQAHSQLAPSPFGGHVHALAVNPQTEELFLGARPIYRSADGGAIWKAIEGIPKAEERANITSIAIDPSDPELMYATGHGVGVVKSDDGGETWTSVSTGLGGMSTEGFAIDAKDPDKLYV